jgi:hypothetical protein
MTQHNSPPGAWDLTVYRGAREAVMVRRCPRKPTEGKPEGDPSDPERAATEAARRARAMVRRVCGEYRLDRLWTLTYREATHDRDQALSDVQRFIKRLVRRVGRVRYVAVFELHPGGHGLHVHLAIGRFLPKSVVAASWGHGFVDARRLAGKGSKSPAAAGRYLAKYLTKEAWVDHGMTSRQRYLRSEGMALNPTRLTADYPGTLLAVMNRFTQGARYTFEWTSLGHPDWRGPPAWFAMW